MSTPFRYTCSACKCGLVFEESKMLGECWKCRDTTDPDLRGAKKIPEDQVYLDSPSSAMVPPSAPEPPQLPWKDKDKAAYYGFPSVIDMRKAIERIDE